MYTAAGTLERDDYLTRFAPLVKRMAHHLLARLPASVEADDMVQAGMIGLMDAVARFEEGQGAHFEAYAMQRIRGAMLDELRANDWLPRSVRKSQRAIEGAISRVEQKVKRPALEQEIARELGIALDAYQELLQDTRGAQLLYADDLDEGGEGGNSFFDRHCIDPSGDPLAQLQDTGFRQALIAAIEALPERESLLMGLYYEQEMNFREIAAVLGVTESRVCQLHSQTVSRLRNRLREWVAVDRAR
jgi:RNA polymerase sigma factor for flagellar operon FliA